jgi:hypothetical protein
MPRKKSTWQDREKNAPEPPPIQRACCATWRGEVTWVGSCLGAMSVPLPEWQPRRNVYQQRRYPGDTRLPAARRASGSCRTPRTGPRASALCKISAWSNIDARTRALFDYHHHHHHRLRPHRAQTTLPGRPRPLISPSLPARIPRERAPGSIAIMGRLPAASPALPPPICRPHG